MWQQILGKVASFIPTSLKKKSERIVEIGPYLPKLSQMIAWVFLSYGVQWLIGLYLIYRNRQAILLIFGFLIIQTKAFKSTVHVALLPVMFSIFNCAVCISRFTAVFTGYIMRLLRCLHDVFAGTMH